MNDELQRLRRNVDDINQNVITDKIDEYSNLVNPLIRNHETYILYDSEGWVLDDDKDKFSKTCNGSESVYVLFNLMRALEYKDITGVVVSFNYSNCSVDSLAIGDGTLWNYCNKETTDVVTNTDEYEPKTELEYTTGKHLEYMLHDDNVNKLDAGYETFLWGYEASDLKGLLYDKGVRLMINLKPVNDELPVEIINLKFKVYFESSLQNEVNVIENRLEGINLPEMVLKQSNKTYLYFKSKKLLSGTVLTSIKDYVNRNYGTGGFDEIDYVPKSTSIDGEKYDFSNDVLYVDMDYPVVYVASRTRFNDAFSHYSDFNIYNSMSTGSGDVVEYRYAYRTQNNATVDVDPTGSDGSVIPAGWSDVMVSISESNRWCFRTTSVRENGVWGKWSAPVLFSYYAKDGEKGDTGAKGADGNTVLSLYINGTDTPTAPSIVKGTIKDVNGVAYTDYEVTPDTIQELFNIIKEDAGNLSKDLFDTDLTDTYGDLYMAYKDWSVEPLPATDQLNTYVTVMNYNPNSTDNSWGTPTLYTLATVTSKDTGSSDTGSIGLVPDDIDTVSLGAYTTMDLYRFGSLVLCRINFFRITSPSSNDINIATIPDDIYNLYGFNNFNFIPNTVGSNNLCAGAYFRMDYTTKKLYVHFNDDNFNKNKTKTAPLKGEKVWYLESGENTEVNLTVTGTKPTITVEAGGRLYVTFYGDGTDTVRNGNQIINQLQGKSYSRTIAEHDNVKTFYKADGTSFDTSYYTEQIIDLNPATYSNQKSTLVYDGTYKTTIHEYNLKVIKLKLKVTAVKLSNNMIRFKLTDSTGDTLFSGRLNIMTWSDTTGYHEKVGHSKGYIDVPCNAQAGLMVMGNNDDNGKLLCESLNGKTWSRNSVTKNGTTCLPYFVKLSDLTTE